MPGFVEFAIFANWSLEGRLHSVRSGLELLRFTWNCRRSVAERSLPDSNRAQERTEFISQSRAIFVHKAGRSSVGKCPQP
jgi:hypothetical protein